MGGGRRRSRKQEECGSRRVKRNKRAENGVVSDHDPVSLRLEFEGRGSQREALPHHRARR
jgi:hypothetical protein